MKVTEHLYIYLWNDQRENNCNSIFIDGKVPLLIDPGHLHRVDHLTSRMRADGLDPERIRVIINTHCHPDHFEGNRAFENSRVKIACSQEEEKFLEEVGRPMYLQQGVQMPEYRIDFHLGEGTLNLGKHEFEILLTPGHSPGSLCIYWPRHKILFTGDLIFLQGVGRTDIPGGDQEALKDSLEKVSHLSPELVIPGHGPAIRGGEDIRANLESVRKLFLGVM